MQTGGAQPHVHPSDIAELKVAYISDITQQCRIADILPIWIRRLPIWRLAAINIRR